MSAPVATPPRLESGMRMDRQEFHLRYEQSPELHGVELIEGVVYMPSPISFERHAEPQHFAQMWLGMYSLRHPGTRASGPTTVFLDDRNAPEPDAVLFRASLGNLRADGYLENAPQLIVEVAHSSGTRDMGAKYAAYERTGVREYIVWRVDDYAIDWFQLRDGRYELRAPDGDGVIESEEFPGLRLHVASMVEGDLAAALDYLR